MAYTILVLGGYGNFGKRICETLSNETDIHIIVAGRNGQKAAALASTLPNGRSLVLDIHQNDLCRQLKNSGAQLVIHTSGPYQSQGYKVAEACIEATVHYIDLADGTEFVSGFSSLDEKAKAAGVLAVSGASSVPGLSSAVIDHFLPQFDKLTSIEYGIAPGNKAERGEATVAAILGYTGRPFQRWQQGRWQHVYGWQDIHKHPFPQPMGARWLASCDIPDLSLFPAHYPDVKTVKFYAGLELTPLHLGMWAMSWLARFRLINNWAHHVKPIMTMSHWFDRFGSDIGGMYMDLSGSGKNGQPLTIRWTLVAECGDGPYIPTIASVLLAKKLANDQLKQTGAKACVGLFTLDSFANQVKSWRIKQNWLII